MLRGPQQANALEYQGLGTCNLMESLDVGAWLEEHGLGQYQALFVDQAIDSDVLPDLTEEDLVRLDVPLGHRKKLLKAIGDLLGRETTAGNAPIPLVRTRPDAERRQLTVLICDMVEFDGACLQTGPRRTPQGDGYLSRCLRECCDVSWWLHCQIHR